MKCLFTMVFFLATVFCLEALDWKASWAKEPSQGWTWDEAWEQSSGFLPLEKPHLAFGYTAAVYWFRIDWKRSPGEESLYYATNYMQMDHLDVRFRIKDQWDSRIWKMGDSEPAPWGAPRTIMPVLPWAPGTEGSVLIRMQSTNSLVFKPWVLQPSEVETLRDGTTLLAGFTLGFLVLMILFNGFMVVTTRDTLYLWYSLYLVAMMVFSLIYSGVLQTQFPQVRPIQNSWDVPSLAFLIIAAQGFAYRANGFQELPFTRYLVAAVFLGTALALGFFALGWRIPALSMVNSTMLVMMLWVSVFIVWFAIKGRRVSRFFVVAWALLLFSGGIAAAGSLNLPTLGIDIATGFALLFIAVLLETIVLAAALADRFRLIQKELDQNREKIALDERLSTLGLLTARVGHEVNTPNHVILLNTSLLEGLHQSLVRSTLQSREDNTPPGDEWERNLSELELRLQTVRKAATQIGLVVSRLATKRHSVAPVLCDLRWVVSETLRFHESRWKEMAPRLTVNLPSHETLVLGVEPRLQQLIVNLVNNAIQALTGRDQAVVVTVKAKGSEILLEIRDEGRGMDARTVDKLGTPFFTTKEDRGGTGLGWGICQEIVREHEAKLEVSSQLGRGTTVRIRFAHSGLTR